MTFDVDGELPFPKTSWYNWYGFAQEEAGCGGSNKGAVLWYKDLYRKGL